MWWCSHLRVEREHHGPADCLARSGRLALHYTLCIAFSSHRRCYSEVRSIAIPGLFLNLGGSDRYHLFIDNYRPLWLCVSRPVSVLFLVTGVQV